MEKWRLESACYSFPSSIPFWTATLVRGRSPVEWGQIPSVHPLLSDPQTRQAGPQTPPTDPRPLTPLAGPQTPPADPQTPPAGPQIPPVGPQTSLAGPMPFWLAGPQPLWLAGPQTPLAWPKTPSCWALDPSFWVKFPHFVLQDIVSYVAFPPLSKALLASSQDFPATFSFLQDFFPYQGH